MLSLTTIVVLAAAATAASAASSRRDVTTVLASLEDINSQTNSLTSTIDSWDGELLGAISIATAADTLETTLEDANAEAQSETQASSADSQTIITYVNGTLNPSIISSLDALTSREADFSSLTLDGTVKEILQDLQTDTDALGSTLYAIASTDTQAEAQTNIDTIDAAFASAIAVFSS